MYRAEYEAMYRLENSYWWYVARRTLVLSILRAEAREWNSHRVLDVGCGTGANIQAFEQIAPTVGIDQSMDALKFCRMRGIERVAHSAIERLPFREGTFDIVTALDVLEHTDDDMLALRAIHGVCRSNGLLVVTVPAYGFLWSEHDEALQHRRRYTAHELRNKLTVTGFDVIRTSYFISTFFLPILALRLWQGLHKDSTHPKTSIRVLPEWLNSSLIALLTVERKVFEKINLPFGVSIVALARPAHP